MFDRLLVTPANEELFTNAPKGSVLSRVNQNNMYSDSDVNVKSMLESREQLAYYDSVSTVVAFDEYKACSVSLQAWMLDKLWTNSNTHNFQIEEIYRYKLGDIGFPISQGSPYKIFLEQAIKDITETGKLERMEKKWIQPKPDCSPVLVTGKVLDFEKLAGPFMVFIFGLIVSLFVMVGEKVVGKPKISHHQTKNKLHFSNGSPFIEAASIAHLVAGPTPPEVWGVTRRYGLWDR